MCLSSHPALFFLPVIESLPGFPAPLWPLGWGSAGCRTCMPPPHPPAPPAYRHPSPRNRSEVTSSALHSCRLCSSLVPPAPRFQITSAQPPGPLHSPVSPPQGFLGLALFTLKEADVFTPFPFPTPPVRANKTGSQSSTVANPAGPLSSRERGCPGVPCQKHEVIHVSVESSLTEAVPCRRHASP